MSFIIEVHVVEGIVLASDSRTTYTTTETLPTGEIVQRIGIHTTDTTDKTFLCPNNCGISTCGDSSINSNPITGYIRNFIREKITKDTNITEIPEMLIEYFKKFSPVPDTHFMVAGYGKDENSQNRQYIYCVRVIDESVESIDTDGQGAAWDGETEILTRLIQPVALIDHDSKNITSLPVHEILWNLFTLQDAINFAKYAVETTINTMHFQNVPETVGGPIDILVITPEKSEFISKKALKA